MTKIELDPDSHEVIMSCSAIMELICVLHNWASVAVGGHGIHPNTFIHLDGRKLSYDLERAAVLIDKLLPVTRRSVDLRHLPELAPEHVLEEQRKSLEEFARDAETAQLILNRLLGPEMLMDWSYRISEGVNAGDLICMAVLAGDAQAKALVSRNPNIGAKLSRPRFVLQDDQCVPVPQSVVEQGDRVLDRHLGPLMQQYAKLHGSAAGKPRSS